MSIDILKHTGYSNTTSLLNRAIDYIVIHYTAGSTSRAGTAKNNAVMFSDPAHYASADFIGGYWSYNVGRSAYCWTLNNVVGTRNHIYGGRLVYVPQ